MPLPTSYTETSLKEYMLGLTLEISTKLGLVVASFEQAVYETLYSYGVDDIADATDMRKLRAFARIEAWRKVTNSASLQYDKSRDSGETQVWDKENQLFTNAQKQLDDAIAEATRLGYIGTTIGTDIVFSSAIANRLVVW